MEDDGVNGCRSLRAWLALLLLLFAISGLIVAALVSALPVSARIPGWLPGASNRQLLWSGNASANWLAAWQADNGGGIFTTGTGTADISTDVVRDGQPAIRLSITDADGQHGKQAVRLFRWNESDTNAQAYYSVWYFFPRVYKPAQYWNVFQWKSKTATRDDPFWILNVGNRPDGQMFFYLYDWQNQKAYDQTNQVIPVDEWIHIEAYYQVAPDNTGRVIFWQDGKVLYSVTNVPTRYPDGDAQWSIDNYTDNILPSQADIYISDPTISRSR